jgi:mRNA deadenylase 3'-5' endonuclease subunit Ccr4
VLSSIKRVDIRERLKGIQLSDLARAVAWRSIFPLTPIAFRRGVFVQWNVMADDFSDESNYSRTPAGCTLWETRKWRIMEEILRWDADVVTLQVRIYS